MPIPVTGEASSATASPRPAPSTPLFLAGLLCLGLAVFAAGTMSYSHLTGAALPGCGAGSPCATVSGGKWGNLPLGEVLWPVSYLGFAYFAGMLGAWLVTRGRPGPALRWLALLGAIASGMFLGIMLGLDAVCRYCLMTHLANFGFVAVLGLGSAPAAAARLRPLAGAAVLAGVFGVSTAALAVGDMSFRDTVKRRQQAETSRFIAEMKTSFGGPTTTEPQTGPPKPAETSNPPQAAPTPPTPPAPQPEPAKPTPAPTQQASATPPAPPPVAPQPQPQPQTQPPVQPAAPAATAQKGFTGRYRFGPEKAGIRVVLFTDYQCPDCKTVEAQLEDALAKFPNVSVSVKHFPFCTDCNPHAPNLHKNACWAARAAETAGILGGSDAYHKMHTWLFARGGLFTDEAQLNEGIAAAGLDRTQFMQMLTSERPLQNIKADIDEALALGIGRTPFIFINGKEFRGWAPKDAVATTIADLVAAGPTPSGPENDLPPRAFAKFIEEWRSQNRMAWPSRTRPYALGQQLAPAQVTVFGDLHEKYTAEVDKLIRDYIGTRQDVRYEFRYFPVDPECNPGAPKLPGAAGCAAARAAEAAGQLGGEAAYWKFHNWITQNQSKFSDQAMRTLAAETGLNVDTFMAKMNSQEVKSIIASDVSIGQRINMPEIPRIFVNGKLVPRWRLPGTQSGGGVLETIIEEAAAGPAPDLPPIPIDPVQNNPLIKQLQGK